MMTTLLVTLKHHSSYWRFLVAERMSLLTMQRQSNQQPVISCPYQQSGNSLWVSKAGSRSSSGNNQARYFGGTRGTRIEVKIVGSHSGHGRNLGIWLCHFSLHRRITENYCAAGREFFTTNIQLQGHKKDTLSILNSTPPRVAPRQLQLRASCGMNALQSTEHATITKISVISRLSLARHPKVTFTMLSLGLGFFNQRPWSHCL